MPMTNLKNCPVSCLLLDVADHPPGVLKQHYLDYLAQLGVDLYQLGFESFRKFIVQELNVMFSDYAQMFFKSAKSEKLHDCGSGRGPVRVH